MNTDSKCFKGTYSIQEVKYDKKKVAK